MKCNDLCKQIGRILHARGAKDPVSVVDAIKKLVVSNAQLKAELHTQQLNNDAYRQVIDIDQVLVLALEHKIAFYESTHPDLRSRYTPLGITGDDYESAHDHQR